MFGLKIINSIKQDTVTFGFARIFASFALCEGYTLIAGAAERPARFIPAHFDDWSVVFFMSVFYISCIESCMS